MNETRRNRNVLVTRIFLGAMVVAPATFVALLSPSNSTAQEPMPFTAFSSGGAQIVVSHQGEDYLGLNVIAWGPNWAWTGLQGEPRSDQGACVGLLSAKMGGTEVPFRVNFRGQRVAPRQLEFQYEVQAEADTELTSIVVELTPGKTFHGRDAISRSQGQESAVRCPFERRGLGSQVDEVRMTDARGGTTVLRFDPPCEIPSDGAARVVLARDRLSGGKPQRLKIAVDLPGAIQWYPSTAELPDEPGIDTWYPWQATGDVAQSAISMQDWIERPAGKHGRIIRREDQLLYNGQPIKLWGLNLCYGTCAPEKALAEKRAAFYRRYGINAVRLHKYADGPGWAGIQSEDSFVEFDAEGLDRMDYQVAQFKEAGIYVKLSAHFGSQKLGPADKQYVPFLDEFGTPPGRDSRIETPHSAVHYSPELQRVQIQQMVNLLKHKNPHTGLTYAEDPVVAFIEIINEQSILFYSSMAPLKASPTLRRQVGRRFCEWLRRKYGSQAKLEEAWGGRPAFDCFGGEGFPTDGEHLDKDNILPLGNPWFWDPDQLNGSQAFRKQRLLDSLHFLYQLQCEFFQRYVQAVRDAGYEGEILSSNWQAGRAYSHFANLHADYLVGTIDRHNYFGGDRANATMLARAGSGMLSSGLQQVADRPFMLSEWIHVFPNELGVEGPAIIGAYGLGLQGWDVSFMFQNRDEGTFSGKIGRDQWDVTAPQVLGVFPAVARQILRGDVQPSDLVVTRNVHAESLFDAKLSFDDTVAQGYDDKELDSKQVSARSLAVARSVVAFTDRYTDTPMFDWKRSLQQGQLVSATGQLHWQETAGGSGGFFTIDTPGTKAVVGFAAGQTCQLGNVTIAPQSRFGAIYVTARESKETIESSRRLLIVAMARARNTGMKFSPDGTRLLAAGKPPIVMEPVRATITINRPGVARVMVLDQDGAPTNRAIPVTDGRFVIDGAKEQTPYYLVAFD